MCAIVPTEPPFGFAYPVSNVQDLGGFLQICSARSGPTCRMRTWTDAASSSEASLTRPFSPGSDSPFSLLRFVSSLLGAFIVLYSDVGEVQAFRRLSAHDV